ncbi:Hydrolase tropI [Apiospora aurea]|uniref:Hydrolase tropI n=1 Tax=Apiospora aurea TaxID=335848 RepID=A0ABR1QJY0_9PEZI
MTFTDCCIKGFEWEGIPTGTEAKLGDNDTYITGNNPDVAVLLVHDLYGWKFPNVRLLADHWAREANATVYVPDFFGGEAVDLGLLEAHRWDLIRPFIAKNTREIREPEIFACGRALRQAPLNYKKVGAAGYCFGGWACFRLAAKEHDPPLVDCISVGHPSLLTKEDVDGVAGAAVPIQVLAPEKDPAFSPEMKLHTFQKLQELGAPFDYQHFPGVEHACFIRGDTRKEGERAAMARGKNAAADWLKQWLQDA